MEILGVLRMMAQLFVNTEEPDPRQLPGRRYWEGFQGPAQIASKGDRKGVREFLVEETSWAQRRDQNDRALL